MQVTEGERLRGALAEWARDIEDEVRDTFPDMPPGIVDRPADVWEPLIAIADAAGGNWSDRARRSAVALVADAMAGAPTLGVRLLEDIRNLFSEHDVDKMPTDVVLADLAAIDEAPWGDLRGKAIDARGLSRRLLKYDIRPKNVRIGERIAKGYDRGDFADAWSRYLSPMGSPPIGTATSATSATPPWQSLQPILSGDTAHDSPR